MEQNQKRRQAKQEVTIVGDEQEAPAAPAPAAKPIQVPISFDAWWLQMETKYKFKPELKMSVQRHFQARGFMDYKKFNQGLREFGFRT
jgi:hypothetical protein